ncbi:response regulator transcription factor [Actinoplanes italicus]|nr:response regulator transcription factor [Actinoplanes italicus]
MRVLVVEDEPDLAEGLRVGLTRDGYAVDVALDVAEAYERLTVNEYDVMLLDVNLPDGDGFTLCRDLRQDRIPALGAAELRVLILTARGGLDDRVRGLDGGADDYLVKPFHLPELLARLRALLRRENRHSTATLVAGDIELDTARHLVSRGGTALNLTRKEFGVLRYLMTRPGEVVSAEQLLEHVWDAHADPFTQTVRVTVGTLRRKLGPESIETVVGRGYRLRQSAT